jgi:hypothetical protein
LAVGVVALGARDPHRVRESEHEGGPHRSAGGESPRQGAEQQVACFDPDLAGKQGAKAIGQPEVAGEGLVGLRPLLGVELVHDHSSEDAAEDESLTPTKACGFRRPRQLGEENPVRPHDGRQTHPLEDEFFRQLAGGSLADSEAAPVARPRRRRPETPRGATDPHAPHPIGAEVRPDNRELFRPRDGPQERPPPTSRRGRLAVGASLAVVILAVALVASGGGGGERATADGDGGVPNGSPASDEARLRVGWGADKAARLSARWRRGGRAIIAGRLTTAAGKAVAGARVSVLAADAQRPEQGSRSVGDLRTDERGRFRAAIALDRGAARKLLGFSYLAYGDDAVPAALARARLDVEAPISMVARERLARRGESLILEGGSAPAAWLGLQAAAPDGRGWHTLARVRAGRGGRWRTGVRVPRGVIGGRYRFRARAAASRRRGYAAAASRPVTIEVR